MCPDLHGNWNILAPCTHGRVHIVRMRHGARHHQPRGACWAVRSGPLGKRSLHAMVAHPSTQLWKLYQNVTVTEL